MIYICNKAQCICAKWCCKQCTHTGKVLSSLLQCINKMLAFVFCSVCLSVSGIHMVSDHIADGEKGWMAVVNP